MTLQEVKTIIEEIAENIGCPVAYYTFKRKDGDKESTKPPYLVFYYTDNDDFYADNSNYCKVKTLVVEYYTDYKDFDSEKIIEQKFNENEITYTSESLYISGEHLFEQQYTMEVIINE